MTVAKSILLVLAFSATHFLVQGKSEKTVASCHISRDSGDHSQPLTGSVLFEETPGDDLITIKVDLEGFDTSDDVILHGFHVHEYGELTNGCLDAGAHYNPHGLTHGSPDSVTRHVGDLGNVEEDSEGHVTMTLTDSQVTLTGKYSVVGMAIVVHAGTDDLGLGGNAESLLTGNAGARIACCVIALGEDSAGN